MSIELKIVDTKSLLSQYIFLPERIYAGDARWVPPLYADDGAFTIPAKTKRWTLAIPFGSLLTRMHNRQGDQEVANALIGYIENWGKEKGMNILR